MHKQWISVLQVVRKAVDKPLDCTHVVLKALVLGTTRRLIQTLFVSTTLLYTQTKQLFSSVIFDFFPTFHRVSINNCI